MGFTDYVGMATNASNIAWTAVTASTATTDYIGYMNQQQMYQQQLGALGLLNGLRGNPNAPAPEKRTEAEREPGANERWLNDRVNEMRVKL